MYEIDLTQVEGALRRSTSLLRRTYTESPAGGGGWYHMLETPPPGATATAVALLAFHAAGEKPHQLTDALAFLRARQLRDADPRVDGGWWTNTSGERPVVEATAWVIRCLATLRCDSRPDSPDLDRAVEWLRRNRHPSGGWGSFADCPPRTWLTCLALRALVAAAPYDPAVESGVAWLLDQRLFPRAWGAEPGATPRVAHTAMALTTLLAAGADPADERLRGRFDWLLEHVDTGSLDEKHNRVESTAVRLPSATGSEIWRPPPLMHYALPVAATALMRHPRVPEPDVTARLAEAVHRIVTDQCDDGSWPNNHDMNVTLWGVWPCVETLAGIRALPLARAADRVVWAEGVVVLRHGDRDRPLAAALKPLLPARPRPRPLRWARRHWAWVVFATFGLGGTAGLLAGLIEPKDLALGLLVPVALLVISAVMQRKQAEP
ncbi:prenyltransferase/squalene oxidase repeat-containing protein [Nonomuraea sp. ATR24]|uniref:prenyltransferase/squalene oxidase repeat-containing protein n=1 Tax=Nonomuraea TaxID=83681 RepID=UPI001C600F09|nr:prenyltransferase/squalene oxidase repeat-containing protein [Nonomuraea ceibae]